MSSSGNAEKAVPDTKEEIETVAHAEDVHSTLGSKIKTTGFMILFSDFIGIAGWMAGFDTAYSGTVLPMETFQRSFGHAIKAQAARWLLTNSLQLNSRLRR